MKIGLILGAVLLIGVAIFLYVRYKKKKKAEAEEANAERRAAISSSTASGGDTANLVATKQPVLTRAMQTRDQEVAVATISAQGGGRPRPILNFIQNRPRLFSRR